MPPRAQSQDFGLYAADGARKYLNQAERQRVLAAMAVLPTDQALFVLTLAWTGARVSEILALTPSSFQIERGIVALRTLKRRRHHVQASLATSNPLDVEWVSGKGETVRLCD